MLKDAYPRQQAIDPTQSFIVQAPAGSGKTELLTQRFLKLLSLVQEPEEIIALTFTRKAAQEMRERIILSLMFAKNTIEPPTEPFAQQTWHLAKAALNQSNNRDWHLIENPNRLKIMTIDALCMSLMRQMPILSRFGVVPNVMEDALPLYQKAVRNIFAQLDDNEEWCKPLATILKHLDNRYDLLEELFVHMLQTRDQWLSEVVSHKQAPNEAKIYLETGLAEIIQEAFLDVNSDLTNDFKEEWLQIARFSAEQLRLLEIASPVSYCQDLIEIPMVSENVHTISTSLQIWEGLLELIFTQKGEVRKGKGLNKNIGFPSESSAENKELKELYKKMKERMQCLLALIEDNPLLQQKLLAIRVLPNPQYSSYQWEMIQAIWVVLPVLVAYLYVVFKENNCIDFVQLSLSALDALGELEEPSDLALILDYKIQHLLVDEFQDTSTTQYKLFEKILAGWEGDAAKTIFLVGDPMQSIYRFRGAEVGLFIKVEQQGIGGIFPQFISLSTNFRSEKGLVDWVNQQFQLLFPLNKDISLGAVPYSMAEAGKPSSHSIVQFHMLSENSQESEEQRVLSLILNDAALQKEGTLAVLVRARKHADAIVTALRQARIPFVANEMETLSASQTVLDLLTLTRAMIKLEDSIAWLSLLRAPWCGLSLSDLHLLQSNHEDSEVNKSVTVFSNLNNPKVTQKISVEGQRRVSRIMPILQKWNHARYRSKLSDSIRGIWLALGGPIWHDALQAKIYFKMLEECANRGALDFQMLNESLQKHYVQEQVAHENQARIQIMTIHKAKGLEFDTVIVPGLQYGQARENQPLLLTWERPSQIGADFILALKRAQHESEDPIYQFVYSQHQKKAFYESQRLLYVAATRAKKHLHWVATNAKNIKKESFLAMLKQNVTSFGEIERDENANLAENPIQLKQDWFRLPMNWQLPSELKQMVDEPNISLENHSVLENNKLNRPEMSIHFATAVGTVMHRILCRMGKEALSSWSPEKLYLYHASWRKSLIRLGVTSHTKNKEGDQLAIAIQSIQQALENCLRDPKACWILENTHQEVQNEWRVSYYRNQEVINRVIDRTFISDNTRWIIDYKLTTEVEAGKSPIIEPYLTQLKEYGNILRKMEQNPIRVGLYFPLQQYWWSSRLEAI